jgi:two-component system, LytTR family, sensor kinase
MKMPVTQSENPVKNFLTNPKMVYLRHAILILVLMLNYSLLTPDSLAEFAKSVNVDFEAFYVGQLFNMLFSYGLICLNVYVLFPRYLKKNRYKQYLLRLFFLLVIFYIFQYETVQIYIKYFGKNADYASKISFIGFIESIIYPFIFVASTSGYQFFKVWLTDQERFAALEKEKLNTELAQLKTQVNPHFLFNTLNNLHVLIHTNPEKASEIVLGLSDVLRYQIYDSQGDKVALKKDIEIITQYLELEKIRRDNLTIKIAIEGNINTVFVPPLLFTNFIDNAIKHSNARADSFIHLLFRVEDKTLFFEIINSKPWSKKDNLGQNPSLPKINGLGLTNVKKRLELMFGEAHSLEIADEIVTFTVKLKFPL